jgi:hypothetical protein
LTDLVKNYIMCFYKYKTNSYDRRSEFIHEQLWNLSLSEHPKDFVLLRYTLVPFPYFSFPTRISNSEKSVPSHVQITVFQQ